MIRIAAALPALVLCAASPMAVLAQTPGNDSQRPQSAPWTDTAIAAETRAQMLVDAMTADEKQTLIFGYFANDFPPRNYTAPPDAKLASAGYVPGIPRLGIPPQWQTDAGLGVATQNDPRALRPRTSLPSGMAIASTWNPGLARQGGAMIGAEARASGFNVMLAGSANLQRDPRNGRTFENAGEDPLLSGIMVGAQIAGIQSNNIISTIKHFALNDQETGRKKGNFRIDRAAARMSDLLAFEIAIEEGDPGAVMCAFNKVNGVFACENPWLLDDVLRGDWGFDGFVMSDWGGTHSTKAAAEAGLDQQSGFPFDDKPYFGEPFRKALAAGAIDEALLDKMATRILTAMFEKGLFDNPVAEAPIDFEAHQRITRRLAEQGAVLLKNRDAVLPIDAGKHRIALIGGHADKGVLSGGGSAQVYPVGGNAVPGLEPSGWPGPIIYHPSSPLDAIRDLAPDADVRFESGEDRRAAAALARDSDVAVVFVTQWSGESEDVSLTLPDDQDALVSAVAAANPNTIVVLETGGPVLMPWIGEVAAALEVWYPGTRGGQVIADILLGRVNPSGHLPATFPKSLSQLPRPQPIDPENGREDAIVDMTYHEGAAVGYKWFDREGLTPLFPFGHGLSYTTFDLDGSRAGVEANRLHVSFRATNTGTRRGSIAAQVYVAPVHGGWEAPKRLGGWSKPDLEPGETANVSVSVDPRLLAVYDPAAQRWHIEAGAYKVLLGRSSADIVEVAEVRLEDEWLP